MCFRVALLSVFVWHLCLTFNGVAATKLSEKEELELEMLLKRINKPAVTIIKTKYGEVYNCIDFYKQPAFDHPALKNHTFTPETRPATCPENMWATSKSMPVIRPEDIWENGRGCPVGTVPIKPTTKEHLIRRKLAAKVYGSSFRSRTPAADSYHHVGNMVPAKLDPASEGFYHAGLQTKPNSGAYKGAIMSATLYQPRVDTNQYSHTQILLQNGDDELMAIGWAVHPTLYDDSLVRSFVYIRTPQAVCYNLDCAAFVNLRSDFPPGLALGPISQRGNPNIYEHQIMIHKDTASQNWYVQIGSVDVIGFYPAGLFTSMVDTTSYIFWGAEAYGSPDLSVLPEMGAGGEYLKHDVQWDAYCARVSSINEKDEVDENPPNTEIVADQAFGYDAFDPGFSEQHRRMIFFGGHGGKQKYN